MEKATAAGKRGPKRDIRHVPAFQSHLLRTGIDYETWERRQSEAPAGADLDSQSLEVAYRKTNAKR